MTHYQVTLFMNYFFVNKFELKKSFIKVKTETIFIKQFRF